MWESKGYICYFFYFRHQCESNTYRHNHKTPSNVTVRSWDEMNQHHTNVEIYLPFKTFLL